MRGSGRTGVPSQRSIVCLATMTVKRGDFVTFTPFVPHEERNLSADDTLDFVAVRSYRERIAVKSLRNT